MGIDHSSKCTLKLAVMAGGETPIAWGTGLLISCLGRFFIVTNWHNVSGRHPKTRVLKGLIPQSLRIYHRVRDRMTGLLEIKPVDEPLLSPQEKPLWVDHDNRDLSDQEDENLAIDVAILPLTKLNAVATDVAYLWQSRVVEPFVDVGSPISIVGYPLRRSGVKNYPIWKSAHIASDIHAHPDQKHFLVDSVTREGMSGSPVIVRQQLGQLLGIYSGRLENDPEFGIGIVWRSSLIHDLVCKCIGPEAAKQLK